MDFILIFIFTLLITISFIGYGLFTAKYINKELLKINIGYLGIIGLFTCTIISYITIYLVKHGYTHNVILHFVGISLFVFFYFKKYYKINLSNIFLLFIILFIGLLIIRNHDDFNYYHLTYSLGLTNEKLILGQGNLGNRYNRHSSIFFLNSIIYLPFIKHYLFHSTGWITLLFVNLALLENILKKKNEKLDIIFYISILLFLFINFKFFRIGGYGTDISGQIIILSLIPILMKLYHFKDVKQIDIKKLSISILLITYASTIKSFLILSFIYLVPLIFFTKLKNLKQIVLPKVYLYSFIALALLVSINVSYSGCALYPVKITCFENKLEWSISKELAEHQNKWYQQWSKSGAGINYRVQDPKEYIKKFNWVPNWYERYFKYKFKETLLGILFLLLLILALFRGDKLKYHKIDDLTKRSVLILFSITLILFLEWFWRHPALRYGGYYLLVTLIFVPFSFYLSRHAFTFKEKYKNIFALVIISYSLFIIKNISRIKEEMRIVNNHQFPLFYSPSQETIPYNIGNNIFVHIPKNINDGCWFTKTPCIQHAQHVFGKFIGPYKVILKKK
jgi:hypothetical protein